jgi:hypothetical protein
MIDHTNPRRLLLLSQAHGQLRDGMFGNLERASPIEATKRKHPRSRVRWGPHLNQAGVRVRDAAISGSLPLYALKVDLKEQLVSNTLDAASVEAALRCPVPCEVVRRLITTRGRLPDHPFAVTRSRKLLEFASREFLAHLEQSVLVVELSEFEKWYQNERRRQLWPSQRAEASSAGRRRPRRPRLDSGLTNIITQLVCNGTWTREKPVSVLMEQLKKGNPYLKLPSEDTVRRRLDELYIEKGLPGLRPKLRLSKKAS